MWARQFLLWNLQKIAKINSYSPSLSVQNKHSKAISRLQNSLSFKKSDDKNISVGLGFVKAFYVVCFPFLSISSFQCFSAWKTRIEWEQVLENDVFRTNPNTLRFEQSIVRAVIAARYPVERSLKHWAFEVAHSQV